MATTTPTTQTIMNMPTTMATTTPTTQTIMNMPITMATTTPTTQTIMNMPIIRVADFSQMQSAPTKRRGILRNTDAC
jgi:hypothetical protein